MNRFLGFGLVWLVLGFSPAFGETISCEAVNNRYVSIEVKGEKVKLTAQDLGGHQLARALKLPQAGQSYRYTSIILNFEKENCRFSSNEPLLSFCQAESADLVMGSPHVERKLTIAWFSFEKNTNQSVQGGIMTSYNLHLVMRDEATGVVVFEDLPFNVDTCQKS